MHEWGRAAGSQRAVLSRELFTDAGKYVIHFGSTPEAAAEQVGCTTWLLKMHVHVIQQMK